MKIGKKFEKKNDARYMNGIRVGTYSQVNKRMSKFEYNILWTGLWFAFLFGVCVVFNTMWPLWLLLLWFVGLK